MFRVIQFVIVNQPKIYSQKITLFMSCVNLVTLFS